MIVSFAIIAIALSSAAISADKFTCPSPAPLAIRAVKPQEILENKGGIKDLLISRKSWFGNSEESIKNWIGFEEINEWKVKGGFQIIPIKKTSALILHKEKIAKCMVVSAVGSDPRKSRPLMGNWVRSWPKKAKECKVTNYKKSEITCQ